LRRSGCVQLESGLFRVISDLSSNGVLHSEAFRSADWFEINLNAMAPDKAVGFLVTKLEADGACDSGSRATGRRQTEVSPESANSNRKAYANTLIKTLRKAGPNGRRDPQGA
jgi:hypothetical protein